MPAEVVTLLAQLFGSPLVLAVGLGMLGGFVRALRGRSAVSAGLLLGQILTSVFTSIIVFLLADSRPGINAATQLAMSGIAGYGGVNLLDALAAQLTRLAKKEPPL